MKITVNVSRYLQSEIDNGKSVVRLAEEMHMGEFQLRHLLKPEPATIDRRSIEKVCTYLIDNNIVDQSQLPGVLLSFETNGFWNLLADRDRIDVFTGVRRHGSRGLLIVAADSILTTNIIFRSTNTGSINRPTIDQQLVRTWDGNGLNEAAIQKEAIKEFKTFRSRHADKAGVFCGSVKSNPAIEPAIARAFKEATPFESQDNVGAPHERSCPLIWLCRENDPHPPSVCTGRQLSETIKGDGPGIYYEVPGGSWKRVAWEEETSDAALVYYRHDLNKAHLDMVLGGFSGRSTRCLANYLRESEPEQFWPPVYEDKHLVIGVYVVKFTFGAHGKNQGSGITSFQRPKTVQVFPLDGEVLESRIKHPRRARSRSAVSAAK